MSSNGGVGVHSAISPSSCSRKAVSDKRKRVKLSLGQQGSAITDHYNHITWIPEHGSILF